ncbi:MAG: DUF4864 domain-containing protein [Alphaproteobacteria bacterium]|nr:DUF4864 domain-containing protein [Alphaproteobacteria bacterium]
MWTLLLAPAYAQVAEAPSADSAVIEQLIRDQLAAFERDDAQGAWKHVAPGLKRQVGSADAFLEMVRQGYRPVYRPKSVTFRQLTVFDGETAQWLDVTGPDGAEYRALYLLEKQADGTWRTSGCLLFRVTPPRPGA